MISARSPTGPRPRRRLQPRPADVARAAHGDPVPPDPIAVVFSTADAVRDFALEYTIGADQEAEPVRGVIAVHVTPIAGR
jgi:hypothetical protein